MSRVYVAERSIVASFIAGALSLEDLLAYAFDARSITDDRLRLLFVAARALRELGEPRVSILEAATVLAGGHVPELERELELLRREGALELEGLRARTELGVTCAFVDCDGENSVLGGVCALCERVQLRALTQLAMEKELRS